ncbi:beta-glucoside-specific PTS transporter subunit IIABC [Peribacillus frigoritolerans]
MGKFSKLATEIVENIGGADNVSDLYHCMTRLRFKLKDNSKANKKGVEQLDGVITVVQGNGQFQVVIGNDVNAVFTEIASQYPIRMSSGEKDHQTEKTGNIITRFFNTMSSIMTPIVPALAGAGMLKALLVILTTFELLSAESGTYKILAAASSSVFYFLPLLLAISTARTFEANMFISLVIMGALLEPNFTGLMEKPGDVTSFLGIPVILMSYSATLIPAMLSIWAFSHLERFLRKIIPQNLQIFAVALISLLIMVPITAMVIGPIGVFLANNIASGLGFLIEKNGLLTGALIGGGWTFLVMFGLHWGVVPAMINNISINGYDVIKPPTAAATFAQAGVALGVFLKAKDKKLKAYALSALMPAILAGVTEPIVYGLSVKLRRPLIAAVIGGVIGGAFIGAMHTTVIAYVFPALTTLPAFATSTFIYYIIGISIAFFVTAALTYILGFEEDVQVDEESNEEVTPVVKQADTLATQASSIMSPIKGKIISLTDVPDEVFSTEAMGRGVAMIPEDGKVFAPVSGTVTAFFKTGHAVGITSDEGAEILIHVGINTVELEGKHFRPAASQGQRVEKGDLLLEFDLDKIKKAGYEIVTPVIITNTTKYADIIATDSHHVTCNDKLLTLVI